LFIGIFIVLTGVFPRIGSYSPILLKNVWSLCDFVIVSLSLQMVDLAMTILVVCIVQY
jgi:hypothetical protein